MATFSERMRELRKEKGITLEKLAEILGTTKATLSRYENNMRVPKIEFVQQLANYFNVSVDYLFGKTDIRESIEEKDTELLRDSRIRAIARKYNKLDPKKQDLLFRLVESMAEEAEKDAKNNQNSL